MVNVSLLSLCVEFEVFGVGFEDWSFASIRGQGVHFVGSAKWQLFRGGIFILFIGLARLRRA